MNITLQLAAEEGPLKLHDAVSKARGHQISGNVMNIVLLEEIAHWNRGLGCSGEGGDQLGDMWSVLGKDIEAQTIVHREYYIW